MKYENRNKYISEQKDLINKKFIDRLKKYFQLIDSGFLESSAEEIKQYKDISDLFIKSIEAISFFEIADNGGFVSF